MRPPARRSRRYRHLSRGPQWRLRHAPRKSSAAATATRRPRRLPGRLHKGEALGPRYHSTFVIVSAGSIHHRRSITTAVANTGAAPALGTTASGIYTRAPGLLNRPATKRFLQPHWE